MIKTISKYILIFAAAFAAAGCSDFLDKDNPAYDNVGFYKSEAGLKEGVTGVYQKLYFDILLSGKTPKSINTLPEAL